MLLASQNVYVNVTLDFIENSSTTLSSQNVYMYVILDFIGQYQVLKIFMWMLHKISQDNIRFLKCLCECYIRFHRTISGSQNVYVNVTFDFIENISTISSSQNVYVNVTLAFIGQYQVLKMFMWMLHSTS
jgi:hypothetical protein